MSQPAAASFALGPWDALQPLARFALGTPDYPDRSATLIVEVPTLSPATHRLSGPGIDRSATLALPERSRRRGSTSGYTLSGST